MCDKISFPPYLVSLGNLKNKIMPNRKHTKSPSEKERQKIRTRKNKMNKYNKLLSLPHTTEQDKIWNRIIDTL